MLHLFEGPDQGHTTDEMKKRKKTASRGIWTHDLAVMRRVFYRCATTTAQIFKEVRNGNKFETMTILTTSRIHLLRRS